MKTSKLVKSPLLCLSAGALICTTLLALAEDNVTPSTSDKKALRNAEKTKVPPSTEVQDLSRDPKKDADNKERNRRDRNDATLTPGDQGNTKEDIEVTRKIRRALVKHDSLLTTAKNVKLITKDGKVTLRGPVKTVFEKQAIVAKAKEVATPTYPVTDEIEVKAKTEIESKNKSIEPDAKSKH